MLHFSRWKIAVTLLICLVGILATIPNFFSRETVAEWPGFMPTRQLTLGLDLQGGSHILLGVDTQAVVGERLATLRDDVRDTLRQARIGYTGLGVEGNRVQVRVRDQESFDEARRRLRELAAPVGSLFGDTSGNDIEVSSGDGGLLFVQLTEAGLNQRVSSAVEQSIEIVRRRIDELGTTEPTIQRQGLDRILVQVPGLQDPARLKALIGQTAKLTFHLVDVNTPVNDALQGRVPPDSEILYTQDDPPQPVLVEKRVMVSGENLVDAQPGFDSRTNEPVVSFRFDTSGAQRFGRVTQQNVGRPFAIILDNEVISAPVIREPILGGSGQISGDFTVETANDLAILLRAGALPAPLDILEERTVGPGLGQDSIEAGATAAVIGTVLVISFMIAVYGLFGLFANIALVVNMFLIIGVLSLLQATLTLPGIAGIVLTIGMAVDANVLIYERIREEQRAGKSAIASIDSGYRLALSTILDANITTLIAAIILFYLGSGPIRGFAVTLAIGIVTTVFTAYLFNRLIVATWVRRRRPSAVPI
ncbi:protein translocase subunit SecD [Lutibaculum baratangense]|uniref:Protein translocase subunit SecD n=1 Tax=Lutibaculum baratangense AMV1 TaxID=631454 RepID=V4RDV0_9HYPH|nr:protein translocase subunit SecD [Lutibaculum baratangense]ESR23554.1 Protein-export membrane protein SecD [Lutibaculum baratangense AMV1]